MPLLELIIICIFSFVQSVFGIGLLLLGTPTFLLLGYSYFEVLNILLPYSITISFLQLMSSKHRNLEFSKKIIKISIPCLMIGLMLVKYLENNINFIFFISILLIIFSAINLLNLNKEKFKIKNMNFFLIILGFIHGISNLGGTLLSIIASNINNEKNIIRYNIATGYLLFSIFQIILVNIFYQKINFIYLKFIWLPILIFFVSQSLFKRMENILYYKLLNSLILVYAFYIFINASKQFQIN